MDFSVVREAGRRIQTDIGSVYEGSGNMEYPVQDRECVFTQWKTENKECPVWNR